jgi:MFS family permease
LAHVGVYGVGLQACGAVGLVASGVISDVVLSRTSRVRLARTKFPGACQLLAVASLLAAVTVASTPACLVLLGAFYFFLMASPVAYHATPAALLPQQAASVYGFVNCCASVGGVVGPTVVGILTTVAGRWERSFEIVAAIVLLAAILLFVTPVRRLDAPATLA